MMFSVVVHVPVEKLENRVEVDSPAAEAEIRYPVLKPHVLGHIAEKL